MKNYYRIRTNVAQDKVVRVKLTQDVDFLEILSLKIRQEDTYKLHVSNYGVIVGRVLANDAFGIPNAKVSVFIPLDDEDKLTSYITNLYPYVDIQTKDKENRRYNLLPDESNDICYRVVGTFPNKRLVLDNQTEIEIFEKYWKYTTVTNKSGDYMIFGVPTGDHQVHVDVDLSDIGVLSQKPRDFMYKGYSITQFDNSSQFKESTNLDNLSQLLSQTSSVYVYPFWGDSDVEQIAITRCDLQVQYKFEPTCVFFGSIVSDNFSNNIGDKCNPSKFVGFNRNLVAGEGTIEMIRKTQDGLIEEFQIQGNRLIDGNGVWCYQIPMNLDYVGTDEFGNIVPTDNPNKGIPTRTSVRFRISMQETSSEGVSRHRAKYLVPNVHNIVGDNNGVYIYEPNKYTQCYEFGSATPDEFFRDLYWNKVYSVKNYIPRIQLGSARNTQKYSAIRTVNLSGNLNPFPFNHARFRLFFAYRVLCILMSVVTYIICGLNWFVSKIASICIPLVNFCPFKWVCGNTFCISLTGGLSEDEDSNIEYFPCCKSKNCMKCSEPGCIKENDEGKLIDTIQQSLAQEYDTVNLDFYNDWVNGCLYLPLWFWKKTKKKKFLFGLFSKKAINRYCNCDSKYKRLRVTENCSLHTNDNYFVTDSDRGTKFHYQFPDRPAIIGHGIIKEVENKDGLKIYYYSPGVPTTNDYKNTTDEKVSYVRLYSTDIILLGSLNECDLDNLPRPFLNLPSTTANIPYIATLKDDATEYGEEDVEIDEDGTNKSKGIVEVTGMDWLGKINEGLFMDLTCIKVNTKPKTCINLSRMSELGVTLDARYFDAISSNGVLKYDNERPSDGLITRYELVDNETRAMFASLNHNGLQNKTKNLNTGYDTYKLIYNYPTDFDGHLNKYSPSYTSKLKVVTYDNQDSAYVDYKFGVTSKEMRHFYSPQTGQMPLFNNSFYFYFGLNEGNTAIDKFNNLFYSECFKNVKYPFIMTYITTPAKWCKKYNNIDEDRLLEINEIEKNIDILRTDYATIDVSLKNIKMPYSYKLFNDDGLELLSESDLYTTELKFGYEIENGSYVSDENGNLVKNGALKYLTSDEYFYYDVSNKKCAYLLDNGNYSLEVIDFNGNSIKQPIVISQSQIFVNIVIRGLGDRYYDGITYQEDICNDFANYGEIEISSVNIDGKDYIFEFPQNVSPSNEYDNSYKLKCVYNDGNNVISYSYILLTIEPINSDINFSGCSCNNTGYEPSIYENGALSFKIWVPGDYKITVTQYCNDSLNDNTSSETINVPNGNPFLTYINDIPLRFIIGKNTEIDNNYFYNKNAENDFTTNNSITGWFNILDESLYKFEDVNKEESINIWSDYVETELVSDDVDGTSKVIDISLDTKLNIIDYKFKCLIDMLNSFHITNSEDKYIYYDTTGGKSPILIRGCYPEYDKFDSMTSISNKIDYYKYDSDGSITCLSNTPNIVSNNYTQYNDSIGEWVRVSNENKSFNELFLNNNYIGNYFAAYTSNAGCKNKKNQDGSEEWFVDNTIRYQSNPNGTNPYVPDVIPGGDSVGDIIKDFGSVVGNRNYNSYFRTLTIDRRIDYSYIIMIPYNDDSISISNDGNNIWKNGRMVGYQYNGVEMCYDSNRNIIGVGKQSIVNGSVKYEYDDDYEFYLPKIFTSDTDSPSCFFNGENLYIYHNNNINNKKLYNCTFRSDKIYDLRTRFLAKGKNTDFSSIGNVLFNIYDSYEDVNGDFSMENYPTIRKLDFYNFYPANRYTYSSSSCKCNGKLEIVDNGIDYYTYNYIIDEDDECAFDISGKNTITLENKELEESAINGNYNISFEPLDNNTETIFVVDNGLIKFKLPEDTANSTHNNFTYLPYYTTFNSSYNPFDKIKTQLLTSTFKEFLNNVLFILNDSNGKCDGVQLTKGNVSSSVSDFWSQVKVTNSSIPNDIYEFNKNRLVLKTNNYVIHSNDSLAKSVTYSVMLLKHPLNPQEFNDFLSIYYFRRYINGNGDNLSKDILTLNIGVITDIRKISMKCICSTESDNQITEFIIKKSTVDNLNNSFNDIDNMSVVLKYDNKITSTYEIFDNSDSVSFKITWDGDLSGTLLSSSYKRTDLFIKMPNGLIFNLKFSLNSSGVIKK